MRTRRLEIAIGLALVALVALVYAQTAGFEFSPLDDPGYVTHNPNVNTGLTLENAGWAFTATSDGNWHPLTRLSHMLVVELFGLEPGAHHLANAALHALNAVFLFLALSLLTGARWRPALVAGLFAVHPLHAESVAWVSERKDVLSGAFFFLTLIAWARYARRPDPGRYAVVFAVLALGLMAKSMLVTLPLVLLLFDFWPLRRHAERSWPALVLEKLPLLALCAGVGLAALITQTQAGGIAGVGDGPGIAWRVVQASLSYATYLLRAVWPVDVAAFHPHPAFVAPDSFARLAWLSLATTVLLLGALVGAFRLRRAAPWLLVGLLWFLGMLVPVIGAGDWAWASRYAYLPMIGIYVAAVWSGGLAVERLAHARDGTRGAAVTVCCALALGALAWRGHAQASLWRDGRTLMAHALQVTERNYLAHFVLGKIQQDAGDPTAARASYERARAIRPKLTAVLRNLGGVVLDADPVRAEGHFRRWAELAPGDPEAHFHLALALGRQEREREMLESYERAIRIDPGHAGANTNVGLLLLDRGRLEDARRFLQLAERSNPSARTSNNMGLLLWRFGELDAAEARFEMALRYDGTDAQALGNLRALRSRRRADD